VRRHLDQKLVAPGERFTWRNDVGDVRARVRELAYGLSEAGGGGIGG
jgi:hypothetical protein